MVKNTKLIKSFIGGDFIKKAENVGMLVFPVIWCEDFSRYNDIAHGIFFEDIIKGFEYQAKGGAV